MALKTIFTLLNVRWPLSSEDTWNVDSINGRGANAVKVGNEPCASSSMSKMSLHHTEFVLGIALPPIKLNLLALYCIEFALVCLISINISDNTRILEIDDSVVDEETRGGGGMENIEVVIFDPGAVEVGSGMCACMKGDRILRVTPFAEPYNVSIDTNLPKGDILCHLILSVLIEEDKQVLLCITAVILAPSSSWMIWVIKLLSELRDVGDGARCGGERDGGIVLSEANWLITLHVIIRHVSLNLLKDLGNKEEMFDGGVVTEGGGEYLVIKLSVPQNVQGWEEVLRPS